MDKHPSYLVQKAEPEPSSMIETFRAIGYSMEAAVADILDNSISAGAKNIWVDFEWKGSETWLSIRDDGSGMNSEQLVQAMRPGSKNPMELRDAKDLGRFGLGLKTASFSQCRKLTVLSKTKETQPDYWTWNLDYVRESGEWNLIKMYPDQPQLDWLGTQTSGTVVVWNELDRLVKNVTEEDEAARSKFLAELKKVKSHLEIVFHRFIGSGKVNIYFQQRPLEAWDPFMDSHPATQKMPIDKYFNGKILVKGFILPHKSKFETENEFKLAGGPDGWNAHQGFYIYRNERLLVAGHWFRMFKKEEHYKLARIQIDLPNEFDEDWQIDIKKSIARPPLKLQEQLKAYATNVRTKAVEVYRTRGKRISNGPGGIKKFHPIWQEKVRHGKRFYSINRDHPFVMEMLSQMGNPKQVEQLFRFIEETVPVPLITIKESEEPEKHGAAFEGAETEPIKTVMLQMLESMVSKGVSTDEAKSQILSIEPFNQFPHLLDI
jgi:hypothetical protein